MASTQSQPVVATLTRAAIFLAATVNPGADHDTAVRALCADLSALLRAVGFRDLEGRLSCVIHGFAYFDDRDLIGFVDGTENPVGDAAAEATLTGEEDDAFAGGSYVIALYRRLDRLLHLGSALRRGELHLGRDREGRHRHGVTEGKMPPPKPRRSRRDPTPRKAFRFTDNEPAS